MIFGSSGMFPLLCRTSPSYAVVPLIASRALGR
jgi:hypothetical protein